MPVTIKSAREIELMAEAGRILEIVHNELRDALHAGMSTLDIDRLGEEIIRSYDCIPSFLNYNGYPASICVSVNDEVVHGIPHKDHILHEGDIVSLDAGLIYKGYHSDMARTFPVGQVSEEARLLMERTKGSFFAGIEMAKAGNHLYDISNAIDAYIKPFGYGIVRDLVGHIFSTVRPVEGWMSLMTLISFGFFMMSVMLTLIFKYLSVILNMSFKRQRYVIEGVEKLTK